MRASDLRFDAQVTPAGAPKRSLLTGVRHIGRTQTRRSRAKPEIVGWPALPHFGARWNLALLLTCLWKVRNQNAYAKRFGHTIQRAYLECRQPPASPAGTAAPVTGLSSTTSTRGDNILNSQMA
jgi:hypothetical protein